MDKAGNRTICTVTVNNGHDWNDTIFTWSDDESSIASRTYKNGSDHAETVEADIISNLGKEPACTTKGETTYIAAFEAGWAKPQTKIVADIPATGHGETKLVNVKDAAYIKEQRRLYGRSSLYGVRRNP